MMLSFCMVFCLVTSPVLAAIVYDSVEACSPSEFSCLDGACVSLDRVCDGIGDCADNSDETTCNGLLGPKSSQIHRVTRQASCGKHKFQCRDGSCISFDGKCDGIVNCKDGSDESHAVCRNNRCQSNWFRCTYGACVDGTAPCNGVQECADNSDELMPRCRDEVTEIRGKFKCRDGSLISSGDLCDGTAQCADGSDETVRACAEVRCASYLFQCAYGACVDRGSDCDGKQDCADNSDEADDLCNRSGPVKKPVAFTTTTTQRITTGNCLLPKYPAFGTYTVQGVPNARPGQSLEFAYLNVSCQPGYSAKGNDNVYCSDGFWSKEITDCSRSCKLNLQDPSVDFKCLVPNTYGGFRKCEAFEPSGQQVEVVCRKPNYYSPVNLPILTCIDGNWDNSFSCIPECGTVSTAGEQLIVGGKLADHGELPWHVGIYTKETKPYLQICGGTLVSTTMIISAAHCFWDEVTKQKPASRFAVAAGKIYRPYDEIKDRDAQKADVSSVLIPEVFHGAEGNYHQDIALVFTSKAFRIKTYIRPACLNFDPAFDERQLHDGNLGKVAGWGLTASNGSASQILRVVQLPFINHGTCYARSPPDFRGYLTSDKICAGYENGTALCHGDSGGGLVFPSQELSVERYYLRGVVSTAPRNIDNCNTNAITSFTRVIQFETFIKRNMAYR